MTEPRRSSARAGDRAFGLTVGAVLLAYAAYVFATRGRVPVPALVLAVALGSLALLYPRALHLANCAWSRLGDVLGRVMNPIVLGVVFLAVVTPIALIMRVARRDPLRRRIERTAGSYWITRTDQPDAASWNHLF